MPPPSPDRLRATERRNPRAADIDTLEPLELVDLFTSEDRRVPDAVQHARAAIAAAITLIEAALRSGGRLFYVGAGTSGRLGVLDASECPPTFGTPPSMVQGIIAGGPDALVRSVEGAEDHPEAGAQVIDEHQVGEADVVAGIAASGTTPFVHGALAEAQRRGARTIFLTCALPHPEPACDVLIHVDVGPELITGSTRLKAGTATKLVLNLLTTGAMIRIGKTWGDLMVDLQVTNAKLRDRGERIVMQVTGESREAARAAIARARGSVRTAIVMLHQHVSLDDATVMLEAAGRRLRPIIGAPPRVDDD